MKTSLIILVLLGATVLWASCSWMSQLYPEMASAGLEAPDSEACGKCHTAIYEEWQESAHAQAWTNDPFLKQTVNYQFTQCLACHAPEPIRDGPKVTLREHRKEEGVNCISCHLVNGELAGPEGQMAPHPAKGRDLFYRSSEMCGTCHMAVFQEWTVFSREQVGDSKTCQECHMPSVHRKTIQDEPWHRLHGESDLRQHTFTSTDKELLSKAVVLEIQEVRAEHTGRVLHGTVCVTNVGVGHSIPPASYGFRETVLAVRVLDASGKVLAYKKESWFAAKNTSLEPGERREMAFTFECEGNFHKLVAELYRSDIHGEIKTTIARTERVVPSKPISGRGGGS